jgi:hypothetical protein
MPWYNNEIMIDVIFHDITTITVNVLTDHDIYMSISVVSWRSIVLVEETGGPGKNHRPAASH